MVRLLLTLPGTREQSNKVYELLHGTFANWCPEISDALLFASQEILVNALQQCEYHKVDGDPDGGYRVMMEVNIAEKYTEIIVKDPFEGIELTKEEQIKLPKEEQIIKENGRGLMLVDHLMDEFEWYEDKELEMFCVRLRKYR